MKDRVEANAAIAWSVALEYSGSPLPWLLPVRLLSVRLGPWGERLLSSSAAAGARTGSERSRSQLRHTAGSHCGTLGGLADSLGFIRSWQVCIAVGSR